MKLRNVGSNQNELQIDINWNRITIFFSYESPVAVDTGTEILVTEKKFSATTSKHINQWLDGRKHRKVSQEEIESFLDLKKLMEVENS